MQPRRIVKTNDAIYLCYDDDRISDSLQRSGSWESKLIKHAQTYLKEDSVILDIGANIGTWSINLANHNRTIHAFEPLLSSYLALCGNIFINDKDKYITPYNYAVTSDITKSKSLKIYDSTNMGACRLVDCANNEVKLMTIDSMNLNKLDFIKMDVEGHELEVIKGSEQIISKFKPVIFFEAWHRDSFETEKTTLLNYITNLGYKVVRLNEYGWLDDYEALPI